MLTNVGTIRVENFEVNLMEDDGQRVNNFDVSFE